MALTEIKTSGIADDAVTTDKLANAINTERTANTAKVSLGADSVTAAKIADDAIDSEHITDGSIDTAHIADLNITTAKIAADAVTGAKIADDAINSEHYTDGSIDTAHIADNQITLAKMAGGTDGQIITYDANGDPVAVGPGTDGQVLTSTGAGSPPAFEAIPASGKATNLILNGAMRVAQRGTSSSATGMGYLTLDRFRLTYNGYDEAITQEQADVASGTTPYNLGFRKCFKLTNGNQNSGAGAADYARIGYAIEAQDIASSGWNYTSASSYITFQFWIKSSVAQSFKVEFYSDDGTAQVYSIDTGSLSANTWTKVTKTIPGNSNLTFNNDNGEGLHIRFLPFFGTDYTNNSVTENAWAAYSSSTRTKDNYSTWWTTNDATFEITGVQLEVGDSATDFAHESYNETLLKCKRYCHVVSTDGYSPLGIGFQYYSGTIFIPYGPIDMRTTPTMVAKAGTSGSYTYEKVFSNSAEYIHQISLDSKTKQKHAMFNMAGDNTDAGQAVRCSAHFHSLSNGEPFVYLDAEL